MACGWQIMTWSLEDRLLLSCCKKSTGDGVQRNVSFQWRDIDWDAFLAKARREGLSALVFLRLPERLGGWNPVPPGVREALKKDYYASAARNAVIFEELGRVLEAFNHVGLEILVLKGAALAEMAYGNLALRPMSDVDLLIKKEDLGAVHRTLQRAGYDSLDAKGIDLGAVPANYLTTLVYHSFSENSICLHIHWHFVNSTIPNDLLTRNIDMAHVWRDADKAHIAGVKALVMAPHHLLIHLAEHSLRVTHSLSKLRFLCDNNEAVDFYGETIDWDRLIRESTAFNLNRLVYVPLYCAARFLNTKISKEVLLKLKPEKWSFYEKLFMKLTSKNQRFPGLSYLLHLSMHRGVADKVSFVLRTLFPPLHVIAQRCAMSHGKIGYCFYLRRANEVFLTFARAIMKVFHIGLGFHARKT